jgi:hypothetical protein
MWTSEDWWTSTPRPWVWTCGSSWDPPRPAGAPGARNHARGGSPPGSATLGRGEGDAGRHIRSCRSWSAGSCCKAALCCSAAFSSCTECKTYRVTHGPVRPPNKCEPRNESGLCVNYAKGGVSLHRGPATSTHRLGHSSRLQLLRRRHGRIHTVCSDAGPMRQNRDRPVPVMRSSSKFGRKECAWDQAVGLTCPQRWVGARKQKRPSV